MPYVGLLQDLPPFLPTLDGDLRGHGVVAPDAGVVDHRAGLQDVAHGLIGAAAPPAPPELRRV
jgi:hypothetical protein